MSNKYKRKGKLPRVERYFQMHVWLLESDAWRACNVYERSLYLELKQRYNGGNNGDIALSHREAEVALNCSNKPVKGAFIGLQQKGLIKVSRRGSFQWKVGGGASGRSTRWTLTEYPVDLPDKSLSPEKDFMRWRPGMDFMNLKPVPSKNARYALSTPLVGREHTIKEGMVG